MKVIRLIPLLLSCLLLGAHFLRAGLTPMVILSLNLPFLLFIKQQWATRLLQLCMILGAVEWLRTLFFMVTERQNMGEPWLRLVLILGGVSLFTALSALPLIKKGPKTD